MCPRANRARLICCSVASLMSVTLAGSAHAMQSPVDEFIVVNAAYGSRVPLPVGVPAAAYGGFTATEAKAVAKIESYLGEVARYYRSLGFTSPRLEMTDGRKGGQAYLVHVYDYADSITEARYTPVSMYMELDLSRVIVGENITDVAMEHLAHELFHAVQRAYKRSASAADHGDWIIEGQAQAMGMHVAKKLRGIDVHKGKQDDYRLGGRAYFQPLPTNVYDETYRTSSFWRYLGELHAKSGQGASASWTLPVEPDFRYMAALYEVPFDETGGDNADLLWLDKGLQLATGNGLAHHYGHFTTTVAGFLPTRLTATPTDNTVPPQEKWFQRLFEPCPMINLTATSISGTTTAPLLANAARCFQVTAAPTAAAPPARAGTGRAMLQRLRGESSGRADSTVALVVQARSAKRGSVEALWLGMVGSNDAESAYIGRDREGFVGDWQFNVPAGTAQTFVVSNAANDPSASIKHDVTLTVFTSAARLTSASSGIGGPINLRFDRFPQAEILSTLAETQRKAGIEQPCMVRLHMRTANDDASLLLQVDNDGPIRPGTFQVVPGAAPEKSPGQFISTFSFGTGRDAVSYRAEGGSVELITFSPNALRGKATLLGRLPKRVYGQAASPWPETMSVQTEFTLVPRVNLNNRLLKSNFCFGADGQ